MTRQKSGEKKPPRALTIAGSDSGGGAGIQADLKAFSACGVLGMTAITAVTAQNTKEVTAVLGLPPELVREQIRVVVDDIGVDAVKTGMLYSTEIISVVSDELERIDVPAVVDPVMIAKSGSPLLKPEAMNAMKKLIVPKATVLTPNKHEAEALSGLSIASLDDMVKAGKKLLSMGAEYVVVKGGHVETGNESIDVVVYSGGVKYYRGPRIRTGATHGTGCSFASFIAACIAKGHHPLEAIKRAKIMVTEAIRAGFNVGAGAGPVNPLAWLYKEAEKYSVLESLRKAVEELENSREAGKLIPETRTNFVYAVSYAADEQEVAGIPGRITIVEGRPKACGHPRFGASSHVARAVLTAMRHDPRIRSAANIRFDEKIIEAASKLGLSVSHYDRSREPAELKDIEGATVRWGIEEAIRSFGGVPDIVYHLGDLGKEPMIIVFGETPSEVVGKLLILAKSIS